MNQMQSSSARHLPSVPPSGTVPIARRRRQSLITGPAVRSHRPSVSWQQQQQPQEIAIEQWNHYYYSNDQSIVGRSLRDVVRELARPSVQLLLGTPTSNNVIISSQQQQQQQQQQMDYVPLMTTSSGNTQHITNNSTTTIYRPYTTSSCKTSSASPPPPQLPFPESFSLQGPSSFAASSTYGTRRMSRSHSPSAILLSNAFANAFAIQQHTSAATADYCSATSAVSSRRPSSYHQELQQQQQQQQQLYANRSPSISGPLPGGGGAGSSSGFYGVTANANNVNFGSTGSLLLMFARRGSDRMGRVERSNSLLGSGRAGSSGHLALLPELSPQQVQSLRRSWKHVNTKGLYDVIRRAFRRIESSNPNARLAFRQNDLPSPDDGQQPQQQQQPMRMMQQPLPAGVTQSAPNAQTHPTGVMEHTRYFLTLLDRIIESDLKGEDLERELKLVGARHVLAFEQYGLGVTDLEKLGEALAESFFKLDGIRQSKETTKVWRVLIAQIIDCIRDGFETELRLHRRRTSALLSAASVSGNAPNAMMATMMAPLESRFCKRNSMPASAHKRSSQSSSTPSTKATTPKRQQQPEKGTGGGGRACSFLRTEFANLTRKLSNL